ncbi:hypothetical protein ACFYW6_19815 [Streptomyces sp. NPDC002659]|uniref:hypothetical protein n=1 Tax=Streptomyces sp. NPDC002659 TaxID=3364656 RepID=UPI0036C9C6B2
MTGLSQAAPNLNRLTVFDTARCWVKAARVYWKPSRQILGLDRRDPAATPAMAAHQAVLDAIARVVTAAHRHNRQVSVSATPPRTPSSSASAATSHTWLPRTSLLPGPVRAAGLEERIPEDTSYAP